MTTPLHHPGEDVLLAYSTGALPAGGALVVRAHLAFCAHCRGTLRFLEAVGGALLEQAAPEPLASRRFPDSGMRLPSPDEAPAGPPLSPADLVSNLRHGSWRPVFPGVDFAILEGAFDANETVFLLRGKAGSALPTHGHETAERVLVLDGRFGIDGTIYGPGDFIESDGVTVHSPFVPGAGDCLCLFALEDGLILPPADEGARAARRWVFPSGE